MARPRILELMCYHRLLSVRSSLTGRAAEQGAILMESSPVDTQPIERIRRQRLKAPTGHLFATGAVRRLYLEDVEAILDCITPHTDQIQMRTDEFRFQNLSQLVSIPRASFPEFHIAAPDLNMTLSCTSTFFDLTVENDNAAAVAMFDDIRYILLSRRSIVFSLLSSQWFMLWFALIMIMPILVFNLDDVPVWAMVAVASVSLLSLAGFVYWVFIRPARNDVIIPKYKKDVSAPWYASDTLKITLVGAAVAAILSAIATAIVVDDQTPLSHQPPLDQPLNQPAGSTPASSSTRESTASPEVPRSRVRLGPTEPP